jgi:hypothetical protein
MWGVFVSCRWVTAKWGGGGYQSSEASVVLTDMSAAPPTYSIACSGGSWSAWRTKVCSMPAVAAVSRAQKHVRARIGHKRSERNTTRATSSPAPPPSAPGAPSPLPPAALDSHRTPRGDGLEAVTALAQRVVRCLAAAQERRRVWAEPATGAGSDGRTRDEQATMRLPRPKPTPRCRRRGTMGGVGLTAVGQTTVRGRRLPACLAPSAGLGRARAVIGASTSIE